MKILFLINEINYTCGITRHLLSIIKHIQNRDDIEVLILSGGGNAGELFRSIGIKPIIRPEFLYRDRSPLNFIRCVFRLRKLLKDNNIDILHSHHFYMANLAKTASSFLKIKTIQTIHGIIPEIGILPHFKSDYYISVNEHIIEYLKNKNKIKISKVSLIRSGVDIPTRDSILIQFPLKILAASRLVEEKGLNIYIKAVALLPEKYKKNNKFYLAGAGDIEHELISLNESLDHPVKFLGELTDLQKHLMENHIFVFPSKSDAEGFPMVVVEAGLASNLIISSNFRGYDSILKNGLNSIIFDCRDEADLADVLKNAINRFDDYTQLREQIRYDCKEKFSPEKNMDLLVKLYQNCLS